MAHGYVYQDSVDAHDVASSFVMVLHLHASNSEPELYLLHAPRLRFLLVGSKQALSREMSLSVKSLATSRCHTLEISAKHKCQGEYKEGYVVLLCADATLMLLVYI